MRLARLAILAAAVVVPAYAAAEPISDSDRAFLASHLKMTRQFVVDATRGLSREQWLYKPGPRWSIAQCVDHLGATEEYILGMVRGPLMKSSEPILPFPSLGRPAGAPVARPNRLPRVADALTLLALVDRAPALAIPLEGRPPVEEVAPRSELTDPEGILDRFQRARGAIIDYVATTADDLRGHFGATRHPGYYPAFDVHDGYQWLLRMSAHAERHTAQIHEVKDSAGYPSR
jgi:hypothetical protein